MSAPNDSNDGAPVDGETTSQRTAGDTHSGLGLVAVLRATVALLRRRPSLLVPFTLAGALGATSSVARIETPYPVGMAAFPDDGVAQFSVALLPTLEPMAEVSPGLVPGLEPVFLAALVGWQTVLALVVTGAFAVVVWMAAGVVSHAGLESEIAAHDASIVPPFDRVGWLFVYVLVGQAVLIAGVLGFGIAGLGTGVVGLELLLLWVLVVVPLASGLFLTPASIVIGGNRPVAAVIESVAYAGNRPFSVVALLLGSGYLGYVLTGVFHAGPSLQSGVALGTLASVAIAGTLHAVVVAAAYVHWSIDH